MVQTQVFDRPKMLFVDRMLGWFTAGSRAPTAVQVIDPMAEDFDLYAAEEALLDN